MALFAARPGLVRKPEDWGDITVEDAVPNGDDVAELSDAYGRDVSDEVLDRLDECRSALSVERNGVQDLDGIQVSILRYLIEHAGPCLVDWGDMQIVLSEDILQEIGEYPSVGDLGNPGEPAPEPEPVTETAELTEEGPNAVGFARAAETEKAIDAVSEDPFLQRRFVRLLEKYPDYVKSYVALLSERGALGDKAAAKKLGVPLKKLEPELQKLHDFALELADEVDDASEEV